MSSIFDVTRLDRTGDIFLNGLDERDWVDDVTETIHYLGPFVISLKARDIGLGSSLDDWDKKHQFLDDLEVPISTMNAFIASILSDLSALNFNKVEKSYDVAGGEGKSNDFVKIRIFASRAISTAIREISPGTKRRRSVAGLLMIRLREA